MLLCLQIKIPYEFVRIGHFSFKSIYRHHRPKRCGKNLRSFLNQLFAIERELHNATSEERHKIRLARSRLEQLPNIDTKDPGEFNKLLPWSATLPIACRVYNNN